MNRHMRRADMRTFRHASLLTHLVPAGDPAIEDYRLLKDAVANFQAGRIVRRLFCVGCRGPFHDDGPSVNCYLFAMPLHVDGLVATSAFCACCVETMSAAEIDAICTRVLRKLAPRGRFLDAR